MFAHAVRVIFGLVVFSLFGHLAQSQTSGHSPGAELLGEKIHVDVDLVDVYFNVRQGGRFVHGLEAKDFVVLEDGRPQHIRFFSAEADAPLNLAILIDTSTSQLRVLDRQHEVGKRFLQQVIKHGDEGLVVGFDYYVQLQQDFTSSQDDLVTALGRATHGSTERTLELDPGKLPANRSTALYDAIHGTVSRRMYQRHGRKATIILTDGQDMGSRTSARTAIESALRAETICYVLLVGDPNFMARRDYVGMERMKVLANETGGRMIPIQRDLSNLEESLNVIAAELRNHYTLAYKPPYMSPTEYRQISIRCKRGYQVQARKGYYAKR